MAAPVTGIDALLTAEAQLQRLFSVLQSREIAQPAETRTAYISMTPNLEDGTMDLAVNNLPFILSSTAAGVLELTPQAFVGLA
ncbi:MAG: hypothetical protein ACRC62_28940 [Microcoleus sp.]